MVMLGFPGEHPTLGPQEAHRLCVSLTPSPTKGGAKNTGQNYCNMRIMVTTVPHPLDGVKVFGPGDPQTLLTALQARLQNYNALTFSHLYYRTPERRPGGGPWPGDSHMRGG